MRTCSHYKDFFFSVSPDKDKIYETSDEDEDEEFLEEKETKMGKCFKKSIFFKRESLNNVT